eukprot:gene7128-8504_t
MEMYVGTIEEDNANWWAILTDEGDTRKVKEISLQATMTALEVLEGQVDEKVAAVVEEAEVAVEEAFEMVTDTILDDADEETQEQAREVNESLASPGAPKAMFGATVPIPGSWTHLSVCGPITSVPLPRVKQANVVHNMKLYVVAGCYAGRALSDIQVLDLETSTWSRLALQGTPLPAIISHQVVVWHNKLLVVGGFAKGITEFEVYCVDLDSSTVSLLQTEGAKPCVRGGHTITIMGDHMVLYGGESIEPGGAALGDVYALDLSTKQWIQPDIKGEYPSDRHGHCAAPVGDFLYVFGGGTNSGCNNELHCLDCKRDVLHCVFDAATLCLTSMSGALRLDVSLELQGWMLKGRVSLDLTSMSG